MRFSRDFGWSWDILQLLSSVNILTLQGHSRPTLPVHGLENGPQDLGVALKLRPHSEYTLRLRVNSPAQLSALSRWMGRSVKTLEASGGPARQGISGSRGPEQDSRRTCLLGAADASPWGRGAPRGQWGMTCAVDRGVRVLCSPVLTQGTTRVDNRIILLPLLLRTPKSLITTPWAFTYSPRFFCTPSLLSLPFVSPIFQLLHFNIWFPSLLFQCHICLEGLS